METKSQEWIEATEMRIREAFELFDKEKVDSIIQVNVLFQSWLLNSCLIILLFFVHFVPSETTRKR